MFLSDIAEINPETKNRFDDQEHINYLDTSNITKNFISDFHSLVVGKDKIPSRAKRKVRDNDLVYSTIRPINKHFGFISNPPEDLVVSTGFVVVRVDQSKANPRFIYEYLTQEKFTAHMQNIGEDSTSTYPGIKPDDLISIEINLPSRETQDSISAIATKIDNKIKLNQKMNKTLEEIAKTLFKSWFIDFDPVRAKAEGRPTGLAKEISDLFPNSFEDSELGEIPKGWGLFPLGEFIDIKGGLSYKAKFLGDGVPLVTMGCINPQGRFKRSGLKYYGGEYSNQHKLTKGNIVISTRDVTQDRVTLGAPALIPSDIVGAILATNMYKVFLKGDIGNFFLFETMRTSRYRENIIASAKGSTVLMLTKDAVLDYKFSLPQPALLNYFQSLSSLINERIDVLHSEISILQQIRDILLPKLISGELKIKDAENLVEEAGI